MFVIDTQDLSKRYSAGPWGQTTLAVDRITFSVQPGQVFGFLGPNGSGKTTTIGMLLGIITPTAGVFRLFGKRGQAEILAARQRIGATLEYPNFYPYLSCRDNLRLVARVKGKGNRDVNEALEVVGLSQRQKTKFSACSLGMKQRLAIGATLLGDPELIVLDEPTTALDVTTQAHILATLRRLCKSQGVAAVYVSHDLAVIKELVDRVMVMYFGEIVEQNTREEIFSNPQHEYTKPLLAATPRATVESIKKRLGVA